MKRNCQRAWILSVLLCVLALSGGFVAVLGSHNLSEESTTELVEIEKIELEAFRERRIRKSEQPTESRKTQNYSPRTKVQITTDPYFSPSTERSRHNGRGAHLRT